MIGNKNAGLIKRNLPVIIAFLIPVIALSIIFICKDIFPFGDEMYLRSDMYHQYAPFMRAFQRAIQEGGNLNYTWDIGLGSNFSSTYAYYLASPLNLVVALFPGAWVPAVMDALIVLKCGLMSAFFTYYLIKHFKRISYFAPVFGIFYAMSAYMAAFSWNHMWLDCLLLLPLIMLGLERLVKENRVALYTITMALAILSNYYIAIMIAIFMVIYFIYLMICDKESDTHSNKGASYAVGRIISFIWYSFISGIMAMAVLLPAIFALSQTASGEFSFPQTLTFYNNVLAVLSKGTILTEPAIFSGYFPNIYCTCALFVLVPLFWTNRHIRLRRKIGLSVIVAFFIFCFDTNIATYIWHGFHFPNSLPCRQSFIFIAVVLIIGYEALIRYKQYSTTQIMLIGGWGIIGNVVFYLLFKDDEFTLLSGLVTAGFIILYTFILIFLNNKKIGLGLMTIILFVAGVGEATFNTAYTGYSTAGYKNYVEDNAAISELLDTVKSDDFYRVEKVSRRTKNDGTWSDYKSASIFSSTTLSHLTDFYDSFGMQASMNAFSYYGHTPAVSSVLGVKYELSKNQIDDEYKTLVDSREFGDENTMYLYENKNILGLGFAVNRFEEESVDMESDIPFECQNSFFNAVADEGKLFNIQKDISGVIAEGTFSHKGRGFIYISERIETAKVIIVRDREEILNKEFYDLENPQIIDVGDVETGDKITVEATDEENTGEELNVTPATMDKTVYEDIYNKLSKNEFKISEYDDGFVKGSIDIEYDQALFTTIPADQGWSVYVDGEKTTYETFYGAFIYLYLTAGHHEVEFKFSTPGQTAGLILSAAGILLFIISMIYRRNKNGVSTEVQQEPEKIDDDTDDNEVAAASGI